MGNYRSFSNDKTGFKITRSQLKEIYSIACPIWKEKLHNLSIELFGAFGESSELSYWHVKEMFDSSNKSQLKVLSNIFPNFNKELYLTDLKELYNFDEIMGDHGIISISGSGEMSNKCFYLSNKLNWDIIDYRGLTYLVPSKK